MPVSFSFFFQLTLVHDRVAFRDGLAHEVFFCRQASGFDLWELRHSLSSLVFFSCFFSMDLTTKKKNENKANSIKDKKRTIIIIPLTCDAFDLDFEFQRGTQTRHASPPVKKKIEILKEINESHEGSFFFGRWKFKNLLPARKRGGGGG